VAAIDLGREAKVDLLDVFGEDVCTGAETDGEQLGLQLAHALRERVCRHDCSITSVIAICSLDMQVRYTLGSCIHRRRESCASGRFLSASHSRAITTRQSKTIEKIVVLSSG
jgi:hypothetical protein